MKMLAASEPEIMENLDSDTMEKLKRQILVNGHGPRARSCTVTCNVLLPGGGTAQVTGLNSVDAHLPLWRHLLLHNRSRLIRVLSTPIGGRHGN